MRVLIFGLADSIWLKEYIDNVLDDEIISCISIISYKNTRYKKYYSSKGVKVICIPSREDSKVNSLFQAKSIIKKEIGYNPDLVHIHFAELGMMLLALPLIKKSDNSCVTFWGSDLLRNKSVKLKCMKYILNKFKVIQLVSQNMADTFYEFFGSELSDRIKVLDFGNPMYNTIDKVRESITRDECKSYFGFPVDKTIIHIGYNGIRQQNHIRIISEISKLTIKNDIYAVLHFGYGNSEYTYTKEVKHELEKSGLEYRIVFDYFDKEVMSRFRLSADLFVYAQTTDAISGSVVEYLYSNVPCIIPSWLDYQEITNHNISTIGYNCFDELQKTIEGAIECIKLGKAVDNRKELNNWNSWRVLAPKWKKMLGIKR